MTKRVITIKRAKAPHLSRSGGVEKANAGKNADAAKQMRSASTKEKARNPKLPVEAAPGRIATEDKQRAKREKVVRDTFTMPKSDYQKLAVLKQRCLDAGVSVKKSELLRAGILLLESVPLKRYLEVVSAVEPVKTGRPPKSR